MLKVVIVFLIIFSLSVPSVVAKQKEVVQSTQGVEVDNSVLKAVKPSAKQRKEQKVKQKKSSDFIKRKKQIMKQDAILDKKQKELEFLQNRLEIKKEKLDDMSLTRGEKGEKE